MTDQHHDHHDHHDHHADDGDAVCPVCLQRVDSRTAPSRQHDGETWYFCNDKCLRAFDKRPDHFVARGRAARGAETAT